MSAKAIGRQASAAQGPWTIGQIVTRLERVDGKPRRRRRLDPLSELVLTILSQNTSDINSARAFQSLRERFPTWPDVLDAPLDDLADAIRSGGLANIKAPRIQTILGSIREQYGELSLDFMHKMPTDQARQLLAAFDGVGPKTVACVLLFSCRKPVLPVDTHVHRVSLRLGLIPPKTGATKAHELLEEQVPAGQVYPFHILLIRHGRTTCHARRPDCAHCVLAPRCPARAEFGASGEAT